MMINKVMRKTGTEEKEEDRIQAPSMHMDACKCPSYLSQPQIMDPSFFAIQAAGMSSHGC